MSELDRIKHLAGLTMESGRGLLHEFKAKGIAPNPFKKRSPPDSYEKPIPHRLPGIGTGTDVPPGGFPKYERPPGIGTGTDLPFDPDEIERRFPKRDRPNLDDYRSDLRRGNEFGKAPTPLSKRAMNDDINRLKHLAGLDEKTGFGRFPGGKPEILDIPVSVPDAKDDGRFPSGEPEIIKLPPGVEIKEPKKPFPGFEKEMAINLDAFKDRDKIVKDDPRIHRGIDYDEIRRRMDKIKNEPTNYLDRYKFKWQGNQD